MTAKKTAAKKTTAKKTATSAPDDALAATRADTPNPELTDLDRDTDACRRCGRDAEMDGLCAKHNARRVTDET